MIGLLIRLCCRVAVVGAAAGVAVAVSQPRTTTTVVHVVHCSFADAKARLPPVIANMPPSNQKNAFVLVFIFATMYGRLPQPNEMFNKQRIGAWCVAMRKHQAAGKLSQEQLAAFAAIPFWFGNNMVVVQVAPGQQPQQLQQQQVVYPPPPPPQAYVPAADMASERQPLLATAPSDEKPPAYQP